MVLVSFSVNESRGIIIRNLVKGVQAIDFRPSVNG